MPIRIIDATPFGPLALIWSIFGDGAKIIQILISKPHLSVEEQLSQIYPHSPKSSTREMDAVARDIKAFFQGKDLVFSLDLLDLDQCSKFQRNVLIAEHNIPRGSVSTYKLLAEHIKVENGARAVGNALATNPFPILVPCHRAIRSDGHLGGFQGGLDMKRALLENEGIIFDGKGRVSPPFYYEK